MCFLIDTENMGPAHLNSTRGHTAFTASFFLFSMNYCGIVSAGTDWLPPWRESGDGRQTGGLGR